MVAGSDHKFCSGVVIAQDLILTAAQCIHPGTRYRIGLEWQLGGFAADPPTGSMGSSDGSTPQLVQAMAGFGGNGAGESLNAAPLSAETSQQPLLTTPQQA
jgi:Trypsin